MLKGLTHKWGDHFQDHGRTLKICLVVAGGMLVLGIALEVFILKEYRTCALMPTMCEKNKSHTKSPFKQLDEGYHGGPKFGLSTGG